MLSHPVRFTVAHEFDIPLDALELAVVSPDLAAGLVSQLAAGQDRPTGITQTEHHLEGTRLNRVLSFQANVRLPAFARGVVTREMCAWDERTTYDLRRHEADWVIEPRVKPEWRRFFRAAGTYALLPLGEDRTRRVVEGELALDVPVVRQVAERMIMAEVRKTFDAEAKALRQMATLA